MEQHSVEDFKNLSKKANLLSEYFIERLAQASEITSLEKKASLAAKAMELLSTMQESSIKRLLESEVAKVTGLDPSDLKLRVKPPVILTGLENKIILKTRKETEVLSLPDWVQRYYLFF